MITEHNGDIFNSTVQVIVHQCNAQGIMGSGIAVQVKNKYPHVYELYRKAILGEYLQLGQCQLINSHEEKTRYICNLVGQGLFGYDGNRYTNYEAFYTGLTMLAEKMRMFNLTSVAFPYNIGCCRGGASWNVIYAMIKDVFGEEFEVEIWKYTE